MNDYAFKPGDRAVAVNPDGYGMFYVDQIVAKGSSKRMSWRRVAKGNRVYPEAEAREKAEKISLTQGMPILWNQHPGDEVPTVEQLTLALLQR